MAKLSARGRVCVAEATRKLGDGEFSTDRKQTLRLMSDGTVLINYTSTNRLNNRRKSDGWKVLNKYFLSAETWVKTVDGNGWSAHTV